MINLFLTVVGIPLYAALFVWLAVWLAQSLAKHNLFFTLVQEGEAKAILHNDAFQRAVTRYRGFYLDSRWNVLPSKRREQLTYAESKTKGYKWDGKKRRKEDKWWYRLYNYFMGGGLVFVGLWPIYKVHAYKFRWKATREGEVVSHDELLDYIYVKSAVYYTELKGVEAKGMVPLDIELNLTIQVINPYKALFREHQWLEFAVNRLAPYIREFIPDKEFQQLVGMNQRPGGLLFQFLEGIKAELTPGQKQRLQDVGLSEKEIKEIEKAARKLTSEQKKRLREAGLLEKEIEEIERAGRGILWDLRETFGVDVQGIEFASISPLAAYQEATTKRYVAERDKERIEVEAAAEVERIGRVYDKLASYGEMGIVLKTLETIKEASNKAGNWVISTDMIQNILGALKGMGKKGGNKK